ncbi:DUF3231 family protein [Rossellomorea vietnamensis]|jgi:Protein of unknown function (DUF3231)|uniref:DUF3231 family protein n=1 Tax=Rossellomorea vietnamensis TaxID=218284 RepID=UPI001CC93737|nr:DUF3231 family protein [Rossellomorea vietnamensis]MCA0150780.1 DUF3231 family protein [Rossellomorea vietnamensis]
MEPINHQTKINAAEYASIWSQYINDSLSHCVLRYFLNDVKDEDISSLIQFALELSETHLEKVKQLLKQEGLPIPIGFVDQDVTIDAPSLFTDTFKVVYLHIMSIHGLIRYSGATSVSIREDIRKYFIQCTSQTLDLYDRATNVSLQMGIINKPPTLNNQQKIDFEKKQTYLTGWFGKRRPINAIEITGVHLNMQKTMVKMVLELGFSQVCQSKELREYMERARKICIKHFDILCSMLKEENLHVSKSFESEVTDSTVPPFSDKLMLFHIVTLLSAALGYYSEALSMSQRRDLSADYVRMSTEITLIAEDGINLLIEKGWMEQPPTATDHEGLAKK